MKKGEKVSILSKIGEENENGGPMEVALASTGSSRRNLSAVSKYKDEFANIENGIVPFKSSASSDYGSSMDIREAVILCQKAYYNFAVFRNTIDLMTEFSTSQIFFKGGSKKSRDFFESYFSRINVQSLQDKFFREYYRSGNVFVYRLLGEIQEDSLKKINQVYGTKIKAGKITIPIKYVILNPADIKVGAAISFSSPVYYKSVSDYELERLKKPRTEEDKAVLERLPKETINQIKNSRSSEVLMPLNKDEITAVFYKKQDYEPFAVPMGYSVLGDINWKTEMKKMDMAVMRTMNQVVLLVTMGAEPDKGGVNQKHLQAMQQFFQNESVARVLIADYTTQVKWVIPDIANLLSPAKYEVVDRDIKEGLNNLLVNSSDKFANASVKIDVFVERLKQARQSFINEFLAPEIKSIAENIGLKNYPTAYFEDIDLKDNLEYAKIYTRLAELGVLTPTETLECIENGRLPSKEESLENQAEFRSLKDKGYFEPIVGGPFSQKKAQEETMKFQKESEETRLKHEDKKQSKELKHMTENPKLYSQPSNQVSSPKGRPSGTSAPKKPGRVGASYSVAKLKDNLIASSKLEEKIKLAMIKSTGLEKLNEIQEEAVEELALALKTNESPDRWADENIIASYLKDLPEKKTEASIEIDEIRCEHDINEFLAVLLYHSKND